jgi:hypothetical protein
MSDAERKERTFLVMDDGCRRQTGNITVDDDGEIEVHWNCGDTRAFTADALSKGMTQLHAVIGFDNAWVFVPCLYDQAIAARVEDGRLFVADDADDMASGERNPWADWEEFTAAVNEALLLVSAE